jgi:hypothetical protein
MSLLNLARLGSLPSSVDLIRQQLRQAKDWRLLSLDDRLQTSSVLCDFRKDDTVLISCVLDESDGAVKRSNRRLGEWRAGRQEVANSC